MLPLAMALSSVGIAIMLCRPTSSFVGDVMFSHNNRMAHDVYSEAMIEYYKCNSLDSNQILLRGKDQQVLIMSCALGHTDIMSVGVCVCLCITSHKLCYKCKWQPTNP